MFCRRLLPHRHLLTMQASGIGRELGEYAMENVSIPVSEDDLQMQRPWSRRKTTPKADLLTVHRDQGRPRSPDRLRWSLHGVKPTLSRTRTAMLPLGRAQASRSSCRHVLTIGLGRGTWLRRVSSFQRLCSHYADFISNLGTERVIGVRSCWRCRLHHGGFSSCPSARRRLCRATSKMVKRNAPRTGCYVIVNRTTSYCFDSSCCPYIHFCRARSDSAFSNLQCLPLLSSG
jgi:hypothetical protein